MGGAATSTGVPIEELVETDLVAEHGIVLEHLVVAVIRPDSIVAWCEQSEQSSSKLIRHGPEGHHVTRAGRAFHLEVVAVEMLKELEGLDDQEVHGKPDRTTPVGVATEQLASRFRGFVSDLKPGGA